jgi:hypothetical protein
MATGTPRPPPRAAVDPTDWYEDLDGDGYGGDGPVSACEAPDGWVAEANDCDDLDPDTHPDAIEICDDADVDEDCDGDADDDDDSVVGQTMWHGDADGDGYGGSLTFEACEAPANFVDDDSDCDDGDAAIHPGADELCDGVDQDCDGSIDEDALDFSSWYLDSDSDGYGAGSPALACEAPAGWVAVAGSASPPGTGMPTRTPGETRPPPPSAVTRWPATSPGTRTVTMGMPSSTRMPPRSATRETPTKTVTAWPTTTTPTPPGAAPGTSMPTGTATAPRPPPRVTRRRGEWPVHVPHLVDGGGPPLSEEGLDLVALHHLAERERPGHHRPTRNAPRPTATPTVPVATVAPPSTFTTACRWSRSLSDKGVRSSAFSRATWSTPARIPAPTSSTPLPTRSGPRRPAPATG